MANRLSQEKSPYLLQHADNPVDWYPWGEEAFKKAKEEDKPVFLSIGYATCHWCHVMEHESFEDMEVAKLLNENAVCIKVDREERPDVDQIYMTVCQALTGSGGWPLSVFMTPDRKPFFAGTYFPKSGRMGMPGFMDIIAQVAGLWKKDRQRLLRVSDEITNAIQPRKPTGQGPALDAETLDNAHRHFSRSFDHTWGGFGAAPKFPTPHHLTFLLRQHKRDPQSEALDIVEKTLDAMRDGGIFDQVGFGFHRYSVDEKWLVPHFEKMLYDQALLAMAYTEAFQAGGKARFAQVAREIFEYVLRDMTDSKGGFYSAEDADSEGREGLFYVWTPQEVKDILGAEAGDVFCRFYDITPEGNFEESLSIPHISRSVELMAPGFGMEAEELEKLLEKGRLKLFAVREKRVHPFKDDKVLTAWNGLMIAALAKGYQVLRDPAYLDAACAAARFILNTLRREGGRLFRRYRHGEVAHRGYADDHAFLVWGLLELYESTFDAFYLEEAVKVHQQMMDLFWDEEEGGFFYTAEDNEPLIVRDKEIYDAAVPSSNSVGVLNLLRLARMTGNTQWEEKAQQLFNRFAGMVADFPAGYTQFLHAVDFALGPALEIIVAGNPEEVSTQEMVETVHGLFLPHRVLMLRSEDGRSGGIEELAPFVKPLKSIDGKPMAYVCQNFACKEPVTEVDALKAILAQ
ncbi:thioredoxin domain-containing protein [Desulforhabdus amnigena]|nr:thioredoxin domain-containing protein [Desulforhabdus amnigena]